MNYYTYKVEHDYGLAPNPFFCYCTLSVCKSQIRRSKKLRIGDWIIGTGAVAIKRLHRLIYIMQVSVKITFDEYWEDQRFFLKRPVINGSLKMMYGDNIYHTDRMTGNVIQEDSAHSSDSGVNKKHLSGDVGGKYVLISKKFYYFGCAAPKIPDKFIDICCEARNYKYADPELAAHFVEYIEGRFKPGINGDPTNWGSI